MRQEYLDELDQLKTRMQKAEAFAAKIPVFADRILENKFTGEEEWLKLADSYKKIYLAWGINRGFFRNGAPRSVLNYPEDKSYSLHLFNIYINSLTLFDEHNLFDLYDYLKDVDIFFADKMNTTFYVTDENIGEFLEALNTWYCDASEKLRVFRLQKQEEELKKKLEETQNKLKQNAA